jgi:hypothetical protein
VPELLHSKALLEQHQHVPQLNLQLGRSGQLPDSDPHDARRQLQQPVSLNGALPLHPPLTVQVQPRRHPPGGDEPQEYRGDLCANTSLCQVMSLTCHLAQAAACFRRSRWAGVSSSSSTRCERRLSTVESFPTGEESYMPSSTGALVDSSLRRAERMWELSGRVSMSLTRTQRYIHISRFHQERQPQERDSHARGGVRCHRGESGGPLVQVPQRRACFPPSRCAS